MKLRWKILILVGVYILGLITNWLFSIGHSTFIEPQAINTYQFYRLILAVLAIAATTAAIIVALLKEEIIGLRKYVKFVIKPKKPDFLEEVKMASKSSSDLSVSKYIAIVQCVNIGKIHAKGCIFKLTSLTFTQSGMSTKHLDIGNTNEIPWENSEKVETLIHSGGNSELTLLQLEKSHISNAQEGQSSPPILKIANVHANEKFNGPGIWIAKFELFSENCNSMEYTIKIEWDNSWENLMSSMKERLAITKID